MENWNFIQEMIDITEREHKDDLEFNIETAECIVLDNREGYYNYQPTSFKMLNKLFEKYVFNEGDQFIDFGCGLGRVLMIAANKGCRKVIGIEVNATIYDRLLKNIEICKLGSRIQTHLLPAEKYVIEQNDNKFFFFNPLHLKFFIKVLGNIKKSLKENYRENYIFLYNASEAYQKYMENDRDVQLLEIIMPQDKDEYSLWGYQVRDTSSDLK